MHTDLQRGKRGWMMTDGGRQTRRPGRGKTRLARINANPAGRDHGCTSMGLGNFPTAKERKRARRGLHRNHGWLLFPFARNLSLRQSAAVGELKHLKTKNGAAAPLRT